MSAKKMPWALIGAGGLIAAAGAYVFWPRSTSAAALPPAPPASLGSGSTSGRQAASGGSTGSTGGQSYQQIDATNNKNPLTGAPNVTPTQPSVDNGGTDLFAAPPGSSTIYNNPGNSNPIGAAWNWLFG